jgi:choline-glycine betaine transporter
MQYWNGFQDYYSGSRAYLLQNNPPVETANNKVTAQYTFFHWGLPWAMYSLFGLIGL